MLFFPIFSKYHKDIAMNHTFCEKKNGPARKLFTRDFSLICLANLCTCMAGYSIMPVLPLYLMDELHCPKTVMGAAMAVFPLMALLFRPVSGLMTDRFNRRHVLILSTLVCVVCFPLCLAATGVLLFMLIRLLHGMAFSSMSTSQATIAVDFMPEGRIGTGIGFFSSTVSLGMIFGPMLGLFVADTFSYAAAFWVPSVFALAGAVCQMLLRSKKQHVIVSRKLTPDMFFMKKGLFALVALLIVAFMQGMITNYVSVLAREHGLAEYASLYFLLMGLGLMGSRLFSGYVADQGFMVHLICLAELFTLGGVMLLTCTTSPTVFVLCGALLGVSMGALTPSFQTILVRLADKTQRGVANSMFFIGMDGGIFFALIAGGVIADIMGMAAAYRVGALGQLVSLAIFLKFIMPQIQTPRSHTDASAT